MNFVNYDAQELETCGRTLCEAAIKSESSVTNWTVFVLDWFARAAAVDRVVWPPDATRREGEFIVDQCHVRAPKLHSGETWGAWYDRVLSVPIEMSLALESEWGKVGTRGISTTLVLDDALKLAFMRATAKVIVFASRDGSDRQPTLDLLARMRASTHDNAPWLWVDLPWKAPRKGEWAPSFGLLLTTLK